MRLRGLRIRLTLLVGVGAAILIAALTLGFNVVLRSSLRDDADQVVRERTASALETVAVGAGGKLRLLEAPAAQDAGSGVWVFSDDGGTLERPPAAPSVQRLAQSLSGRDDAFAQDDATDTRLYAKAVRDDSGSQVGTVVASLSLEPYERTVGGALIASIAFAALMLIGIIGASQFLLGRALRPVARMTREATDWSEHDLDHRFAAGEPYDEITELAAAFDSMLDRLASSLRHEQRLSAEISHELRTPLTAILAETELALSGHPDSAESRVVLERIAERATALRRILETLLAAARAETDSVVTATPVTAVIERVVEDAAPLASSRRVRLSSAGPAGGDLADVDPALLERILSPVIENACRFADSSVSLGAHGDGSTVTIAIADDGPGIAPEDRERIFEPGVRGAVARDDDGAGAGLGLALARRLARAAGGDLTLADEGAARGARFELRLPASPAGSARLQ
jgi:signal transduction histidine kinase